MLNKKKHEQTQQSEKELESKVSLYMRAPFSSFLLVHTMLWHINTAVVRAIFNLNTNIVFYLTTNMHSGPETVRYRIVTTNSRKYFVFSFWEYADVECALAKTKDSSVAHTNARICLFSVAVVLLNSMPCGLRQLWVCCLWSLWCY